MILKKLTTAVLALSMLFILNGCGLMPLPDEERYQTIERVKKAIAYESTGEVISSNYDSNDGVSSPSYFEAYLKGAETFDSLSSRVAAIDGVKCTALSSTQTTCRDENVLITVNRKSESSNSTYLQILDPSNGRK